MTDKEETVLFVVRHGETEWNVAGKAQGHLDSPLTAVGVQQAHALAGGLFGRGIEIIYSSDLGRAVRTAEIIGAKLGLPVTIDSRLRERHLGSMQGLTMMEFQERFPAEFAAFKSGDPDYVLPGGESRRQQSERCVACCAELATRHLGQTLLLVAHGGVLMNLFRHVLAIPLSAPRRFSIFNAAVNRFSVRGNSWRLDTWDDISHLRGMNSLDDN